MAVVAIMACGLGLWIGAMRRSRQAAIYRNKAIDLARAEQDHRNRAARTYNSMIVREVRIQIRREKPLDERDEEFVRRDERLVASQQEMVRYEDRVADYYRDLARKYGHAAAYPWKPVPDDPPLPGQFPAQRLSQR